VRTLIIITIIMLSATSFAFAQSGDKMDGKLMAKASIRTYGAHIISGNKPVGENSVSSQSRIIASVNKSEAGTEPFDAVSREQDEDPDDISLAIINELKSEAKTDSGYKSHKLKAEDLPLVISSGDRKTTSVVIPPFLYFKTKF
jgi:hypothetical protein